MSTKQCLKPGLVVIPSCATNEDVVAEEELAVVLERVMGVVETSSMKNK